MTRYRLVAEHRAQWGVEERCRVLQVSRSGYYDWQQRPPSPRAEQTQRLDTTIKELFEASQRRSGSPKITRELTKRGWRVSKNRVPRRMRLPGLRSIVRRRFRVTTNSKHRYPVAPDRLQRNFTAQPRAVALRRPPRGLIILIVGSSTPAVASSRGSPSVVSYRV